MRAYTIPPDYASEPRFLALRSAMPLTGALIFLYIVCMVLFGENPKTVNIVMPVVLAVVLAFIAETMRIRQGFSFPVPLVWFLIYLGYSAFQMIWSPGSVGTLMLLVEILVLALVLVNSDVHGRVVSAVEYAFYFAVLCTFVYNLFSNEIVLDGRIGSTLVNANAYSQALMFGVLLAFRRALSLSAKRGLNWRYALMLLGFVCLSIYGIVFLAGSRKGIVLTVVASLCIVVYWVWQQPIRRRMLVSAAVVVVLAGAGYVLYRSPQVARITDISTFLQGGNATDTGLAKRGGMLGDALGLWQQRPLTGWGLDQFKEISGWGTYSHDNYAELLANQGLIGCLAYVMIYISALLSLVRSLWRSKGDAVLRADAFWAVVVVVVMMGWDFAAVSYYDRLSWVMLSVVIAVSVRARRARVSSVATTVV
jgi:O-antigen ligase